MKKITLISCLSFFCAVLGAQVNKSMNLHPGSIKYFSLPADMREGSDYMTKTIIFAVKDQYRANCNTHGIDNLMDFNNYMLQVGALSVEKIYPAHKAPEKKFNELGQKYADLSLIYVLKYSG